MNRILPERLNLPETGEELTDFIMSSEIPMTQKYNRGVCLVWLSRRWDIMSKYCTVVYPHPGGLLVRVPSWFDGSEAVSIPMPKALAAHYREGVKND